MSITLLYSTACCVMIYNKKNVAVEMSDVAQAAEVALVGPPMIVCTTIVFQSPRVSPHL
jgi:hypothetical protein